MDCLQSLKAQTHRKTYRTQAPLLHAQLKKPVDLTRSNVAGVTATINGFPNFDEQEKTWSVELDTSVQVTNRLSLIFDCAHITEAEITTGNEPRNTTDNTANFWATYEFTSSPLKELCFSIGATIHAGNLLTMIILSNQTATRLTMQLYSTMRPPVRPLSYASKPEWKTLGAKNLLFLITLPSLSLRAYFLRALASNCSS